MGGKEPLGIAGVFPGQGAGGRRGKRDTERGATREPGRLTQIFPLLHTVQPHTDTLSWVMQSYIPLNPTTSEQLIALLISQRKGEKR